MKNWLLILCVLGMTQVVKAQTGFSLRFNRVIDTVIVINQTVNCGQNLFSSPVAASITFVNPTKVLSISGTNTNSGTAFTTSCSTSGGSCSGCLSFQRLWTVDGYDIPVTDNFDGIRWVKPGTSITIRYGSSNASYPYRYAASTFNLFYTVHVTALEFIAVP